MTDKEFKCPQIRPGTVSNILWHFPGGPYWDEVKKKQEDHPKPSNEAYKNLCSILGKDNENQTKELRTGKYKEIIRLTSELEHVGNKKYNILNSGEEVIESNPVCCLAEIPVIYLNYMESRYNKFAIGFHRKSVLNQFNPVLYTFESSFISGAIRKLHKNSSALKSFPEYFNENYSKDNDETNTLDSQIKSIYKNVEIIVSFTKTIEEKELESIYCEREWRSINSFKFQFNDIAMIILPKKANYDNLSYFDIFMEEEIDRLSIPREIPIVAWEDLIEH